MSKPRYAAACWLAIPLLLAACAGPKERIILLPDPGGHVGVIDVRTAGGSQRLNEAYTGTRISGSKMAVETLGEATVRQNYAAVLDSLPAQPETFTLNFELGRDKLTAESRSLLPKIQETLRRFPAPEVVVTGHTDAAGSTAFNDKLSLERAYRVRDILVQNGVAAESIQLVGRGSREPLVATRPGVPEARNRRVEIKLR